MPILNNNAGGGSEGGGGAVSGPLSGDLNTGGHAIRIDNEGAIKFTDNEQMRLEADANVLGQGSIMFNGDNPDLQRSVVFPGPFSLYSHAGADGSGGPYTPELNFYSNEVEVKANGVEDAQFTVNMDNGLNLKRPGYSGARLATDEITSQRVLQLPDKDGTIATLDDVGGGGGSSIAGETVQLSVTESTSNFGAGLLLDGTGELSGTSAMGISAPQNLGIWAYAGVDGNGDWNSGFELQNTGITFYATDQYKFDTTTGGGSITLDMTGHSVNNTITWPTSNGQLATLDDISTGGGGGSEQILLGTWDWINNVSSLDITTSGSGSTTIAPVNTLTSGSTAGSFASLRGKVVNSLSGNPLNRWAYDCRLTALITVATFGEGARLYIGQGDGWINSGTGTNTGFWGNTWVGFRITKLSGYDYRIEAMNTNGTTSDPTTGYYVYETTSVDYTGRTAGTQYLGGSLRIDRKQNSIDYYVDGELFATHTTYIPNASVTYTGYANHMHVITHNHTTTAVGRFFIDTGTVEYFKP